jgi:hypothetical protein
MNLPEKLTFAWLCQHAQLHLVSAEDKWTITAWKNVVCLKIRGGWTPEEAEEYVHHFAGLPGMLECRWDKIYLVFDISDMRFRRQDAHLYLRSNWLETIDRKELAVCIVEKKRMRRLLWHSLYTLVGKRNRVKLVAATDEALAWVHAELARTA